MEKIRDMRNVERDRHMKGSSSGTWGCLINFSECGATRSIFRYLRQDRRNKTEISIIMISLRFLGSCGGGGGSGSRAVLVERIVALISTIVAISPSSNVRLY